MNFITFILLLLLTNSVLADSELTIGGKTAAAHIIQANGVSLRPRPYLNITGDSVIGSDSGGKTVITISGGSGSGNVGIGSTMISGTTGSVLFVGSGPVFDQDNTNLFWNDSGNNLGIGTLTPYGRLHLYNSTASDPAQVFGNGAGNNLKIYHSAVDVLTPSYSNPGGTGDRDSTITVTTTLTMDAPYNDITKLVDGQIVTEQIVFSIQSTSGKYIRFDFGSGASELITEAKWYQNSGTSGGVWQWQGSDDAAAWTSIGSSFTLANGSATQTQTELSGNTTGYRYYQLLGVSGSTSDGPWIEEIEFKIGDPGGSVSQFQQYTGGTSAGGVIALQPDGGNVGIGNETGANTLDVTGTASFSSNVGIGTTTVSGGRLIVHEGNVGIGSLTPGAKLDVFGSLRVLNGGPLVIPQGTAPTANDPGELAHDTTADQLILDDHVVGTKNQRLYFPVKGIGGNVGIGTSSIGNVEGFTISNIQCQVDNGTSMTIDFRECAQDGSSCSYMDGTGIVCDTNGTSDSSFSNAVIDKDDLMKLEVIAVSGAVTGGSVTVVKEITRE